MLRLARAQIARTRRFFILTHRPGELLDCYAAVRAGIMWVGDYALHVVEFCSPKFRPVYGVHRYKNRLDLTAAGKFDPSSSAESVNKPARVEVEK